VTHQDILPQCEIWGRHSG